MYAVIETGGKQYQVKEGDELYVEKLGIEEGSVNFDKVLMISEDDGISLGDPYVAGATVSAVLIKNGKQKKIIVFNYKSKKGEKKCNGHRQPYSKVKIEKINF